MIVQPVFLLIPLLIAELVVSQSFTAFIVVTDDPEVLVSETAIDIISIDKP